MLILLLYSYARILWKDFFSLCKITVLLCPSFLSPHTQPKDSPRPISDQLSLWLFLSIYTKNVPPSAHDPQPFSLSLPILSMQFHDLSFFHRSLWDSNPLSQALSVCSEGFSQDMLGSPCSVVAAQGCGMIKQILMCSIRDSWDGNREVKEWSLAWWWGWGLGQVWCWSLGQWCPELLFLILIFNSV